MVQQNIDELRQLGDVIIDEAKYRAGDRADDVMSSVADRTGFDRHLVVQAYRRLVTLRHVAENPAGQLYPHPPVNIDLPRLLGPAEQVTHLLEQSQIPTDLSGMDVRIRCRMVSTMNPGFADALLVELRERGARSLTIIGAGVDPWNQIMAAAERHQIQVHTTRIDDQVNAVANAILEQLGPLSRAGKHVRAWPADEQAVYDQADRSAADRDTELSNLLARKAAIAAIATLSAS